MYVHTPTNHHQFKMGFLFLLICCLGELFAASPAAVDTRTPHH